MSMPIFFWGKSRTWPIVARTLYARPRYFPMVFAFAGDSTITRDVEPGSDGPSSSMIFAAALFLARLGLIEPLFAATPLVAGVSATTLFVARLAVFFGLAVLALAI
jgi:hypothetical protein